MMAPRPDSTIRIMHVISGLDQGGAEAMLVRLLRTLDRESFSQSVVSLTTRGVYGDQIEASGIPLYALGMTGFAAMPGSLARLYRAIKEHRPSIVQTWLYHADLLGLIAARAAGDASVAWNVRCAGLGPGDVPRSTRWLTSLLARLSARPDAILFNSMAGLKAHQAIGYRPRHSEVIPNGFDLEERRPDPLRRADFRSEIGVDGSTFLVGMIARAHRMKDQSTFLAAAARLKDMGAVRFVLVGLNESWTNKSLVADIDKHGLRDRISLLGLRHDVPRVMAGLDCLVSTSTSEGFPNVIGEAMACGVPCVATDAGDSRVIVGDTGRILPIGDIAGVVEGVAQLMAAGAGERERRSERCRARITEHFELSRVAARYAGFYRELDGMRRRMAVARPQVASTPIPRPRPVVSAPGRMKIACFMSALNAGGAERVTVDLASVFAECEHDVTVFVGWPSESEAPARDRLDPRVHVEYILPSRNATGRRYFAGLFWTWKNRARLCSFDVVHCHLTYGAFVGTLLSVYRRLVRSPRPVIIETYHAVGMRISPVLRRVHALMAVHRDVLVLMASDPYWSRFTERHPRLIVRTVLNGTSAPNVDQVDERARQAYRRSLGIPDDCAFVLGSVGFLRSDRQPELFVPIIAHLVRECGRDVHWIYAGDGPEQRKLEALVAEAGIAGNVHFAGFVADVKYPLSVIDLYFTLSVGEVTGVAALEAALAGVPVIGVQLLPGHQAGSDDWIWSSDDPRAVADMAAGLLRSPAERAALGERQKEYARAHHSVRAMGESYKKIYERALAGLPGRQRADVPQHAGITNRRSG